MRRILGMLGAGLCATLALLLVTQSIDIASIGAPLGVLVAAMIDAGIEEGDLRNEPKQLRPIIHVAGATSLTFSMVGSVGLIALMFLVMGSPEIFEEPEVIDGYFISFIRFILACGAGSGLGYWLFTLPFDPPKNRNAIPPLKRSPFDGRSGGDF